MPKVEILQQKGFNFLWIDDELWMWDVPEEVKEQQKIADQAYGKVLVAGCGLGVIQRALRNNPKVDEIFTIEIHEEVYKACCGHGIKVPGGMYICDFYNAMSKDLVKYDCVIGDIWPEYTEGYLSKYVRFKTKAKTFLAPGGKILGWGMQYFEYLLTKGE